MQVLAGSLYVANFGRLVESSIVWIINPLAIEWACIQ